MSALEYWFSPRPEASRYTAAALVAFAFFGTGCAATIDDHAGSGSDGAVGATDLATDPSRPASDLATGIPLDLATLDIGAPDLANPDLAESDLAAAADLAILDLAHPDLAHPDLAHPDLAPPFTPVAGVHTELPISPDVAVLDGQWLLDLYRTVLARDHDVAGYKVNFGALQSGMSRAATYDAFIRSAEFQNNASLHGAAGFVTRTYQTVLGRTPTVAEVNLQVGHLCNYDGTGCPMGGIRWPSLIDAFYASAEFKANRCVTGYYTLGAKVTAGAPLLRDLWNGTARFQTLAESEEVKLTLPSALGGAIWDQKLPILADPKGKGYIAFTRALQTKQQQFTIVMVRSNDGLAFTEVAPVFDRSGNETWYDPHVSVDSGYCPARYVMAMECLGQYGGASLCTSQTSTPDLPETWSRPTVVIDGCPGGGACGTQAAQSASTGVTLFDGKANRYAAWTQVYDGVGANDPQAHTYSQSIAVTSFGGHYGNTVAATVPIHTMMSAEPNVACNGIWDCNNRDKQDWKREGTDYYALYNGANYYRCTGTNGNGAGVNLWGLSVARSANAQGAEYSDRLPAAKVLYAERKDVCGISYPMLNVLGGELYVYYAYYPKAGGNRTMRAKLVR